MQNSTGFGVSVKQQFKQQPLLMSLLALCTLYVGSLVAAAIMYLVDGGQEAVTSWLHF
jgi:hypothetical protein